VNLMSSWLKTIWENREKRFNIGLCLILIVCTIAVYGRMVGFDFIDYDDPTYVSNNQTVSQGLTWEGIKWAFTTSYAANWSPLTWLSFMSDREIFGSGAAGFHLTNVLLHIANTLLLFWVLKRYSNALYASFFVAAIFGLHPLHVESVAWVTERKDVLSTLFWMLTMLAYLRYLECRTVLRYMIMLVVFSLGLMAKPMLVTLPFVLLILDYWPLRRLSASSFRLGLTKLTTSHSGQANSVESPAGSSENTPGVGLHWLIIEKIPLLILSVISSWVTFVAQKTGGSVVGLSIFPLDYRIGNALVSYCEYILKMFYPIGLAAFYPHSAAGLEDWKIAASIACLLTITVVVILLRNHRYLLAGGLWYLGTLVPVVGIVQVGRQAMADRYTYIPLIGLFVMLVWFAADIIGKWRYRAVVVGITGTILISTLMVLTFKQVGYWRDTMTLFTHTVGITEDNYLAHSILATHYAHNGDFDKARSELGMAMGLKVNEIDVLYNIATCLAVLGRTDEAIVYYNKILAITPGDSDTYIALASMETDKRNFERAIDLYRKGLKYHPERGDLHGQLGSLFYQMGQVDQAIPELETAVKLKEDSKLYGNLGVAVSSKGQVQRAIECYEKAIQLDSFNAEAHYNFGNLYLAQDKPTQAADEYIKAIKIRPNYSKAYGNLGLALSFMGKYEDAVEKFHNAINLDPNNVEARFNLAASLADKGLIDEPVEQLRKILELLPDNNTVKDNLSALLLQKTQIEQAISQYEQFLQVNPNDTVAQEGLKKAKEALAIAQSRSQ
jgi:protein O-mannosyl-transferase